MAGLFSEQEEDRQGSLSLSDLGFRLSVGNPSNASAALSTIWSMGPASSQDSAFCFTSSVVILNTSRSSARQAAQPGNGEPAPMHPCPARIPPGKASPLSDAICQAIITSAGPSRSRAALASETSAYQIHGRKLMRTVIISGSRNPDGQTARAAEALLEGLASAGADGEMLFLPSKNIERCRQCDQAG